MTTYFLAVRIDDAGEVFKFSHAEDLLGFLVDIEHDFDTTKIQMTLAYED